MEKRFNKQKLKYLTEKKLLYHLQSCFLPQHSTIAQLIYIVHTWQMCLDYGDVVQASFSRDLSKAYDSVRIDGLVYKLPRIGFLPPTLQWFKSFLSDRKQLVTAGDSCSCWRITKSGIPQGTVLGPILFLIFINDRCQVLTSEPIVADDSTVFSRPSIEASANKLNTDITAANSWAEHWDMDFNAGKSEHLLVTSSRRKAEASQFHYEVER